MSCQPGTASSSAKILVNIILGRPRAYRLLVCGVVNGKLTDCIVLTALLFDEN